MGMTIWDKLYSCEAEFQPLTLTATEVGDLVEEIEEMRLQFEVQLIMAHRALELMTGTQSETVN